VKDSQEEDQRERSRNIYQSSGLDWCGGSNKGKNVFNAKLAALREKELEK